MEPNKYPYRYFLFLLIALVLAVVFWLVIFSGDKSINPQSSPIRRAEIENRTGAENWNRDYLPEQNGQIIPIDTNKIITDTLNNRKIVSNIVNLAIKSTIGSIMLFANDLKKQYPGNQYKILYIDSVINRLQLQLPDEERLTFKQEVKSKLSNYNILVWDEVLFDYVKSFNDPKLQDNKANWYLKAINIEKEWDKTIEDKNVIVAVIDNGFDLNHPELLGKAVGAYNVIDKSSNVNPSQQNHGTHVASTILANENNNEGIVGICSGCSFIPIKVEDRNGHMSNSYIIDAILYAIKNKADVINLSLGMFIPGNTTIPTQAQQDYIKSNAKDEEEFWNDLFDYADKNNVTCVLAAGNNDILTGFDPFQRSRNTIKVGAVDQNLNKAKFSNFGDKTTIYAPGVGIFGAKPNNSYEFLSGTSMAAPIVSGFIGLLKSQNKNITNQQIINLLTANSVKINNLNILKSKN